MMILLLFEPISARWEQRVAIWAKGEGAEKEIRITTNQTLVPMYHVLSNVCGYYTHFMIFMMSLYIHKVQNHIDHCTLRTNLSCTRHALGRWAAINVKVVHSVCLSLIYLQTFICYLHQCMWTRIAIIYWHIAMNRQNSFFFSLFVDGLLFARSFSFWDQHQKLRVKWPFFGTPCRMYKHSTNTE